MKTQPDSCIDDDILIVDDSKPHLELLVKILCDAGYNVRSASNGELALRTIQVKLPALILLDVKMPDMDGYEVCRRLKTDERTRTIPIIFISAWGDDKSRIKGFQVGGVDFINKPFYSKEVLARVKAHVELRKMQLILENQNSKLMAEIAWHKQAEEALKFSEEKYRNIFNNVLDVLYQININGIIEEISPSVNLVFGFTRDDLIGKSILALYFDSNDREVLLKSIINNNEIKDYELRMKTKSGDIKYVSLNSRLVYDSEGKPSYIDGIMRDVTEYKKMTTELIKAKEKAEEGDRLKTSFLHNISHEIRTPLNAIRGFSELLNDPGLLPEEEKTFREIIIESSDHLLSIITGIVNISSLETGQEKLNEKEVNLNSMCDIIKEMFLSKIKDRNIILRQVTNLPDNESNIITDETKLIQILSNLVSNAVKFTKEGVIEFGYLVKDPLLEFYVKDTGIGITTEVQEEIFKRFRQGETNNNRQYGGSGLGLSISKAYTELLGGKMWLTSEPGIGSVFYFTIPYKKVSMKIPESEQSELPLTLAETELKKSKILLVAEDEDLNFLLVQKFLSGLNYIIIRAKTGLEVVKMCCSDLSIDLVLMDIKMPFLNGYEATSEIKKRRPDLPVIALTAYSSEEDKDKAIACGCSAFISKPFKREELISKIKAYLE